METTNNTNNTVEQCKSQGHEVWVVNSGTETVCHDCGSRTETGHQPTVSVRENQFR